jgi:phosphate:Na+ symporter
METTMTLEYGEILMTLFGGLAIFLYGMEQLDNALKRVAGARMKNILATLTTNRFTGVFTGTLVTSVLQSSSVTTVLVVGFVSAGLMTLIQSIGVIMGANIGTTITAQIVAFKVTHYALWMVAIGFVLYFVGQKEKLKQYGLMLIGLGLVFYGLSLMGDATKPLRTYAPFITLMHQMENPLLGILVGGLFTGIIQSSSATTGIIIVLASQGLITLDAGIALAFGANLGTCITALLASIGRPRVAVQTALVHVLFNVGGVLLWFFFIPQLSALVTWFSPSYPNLTGIERMAAETPRQIANAHTLFNITNTFVFIWFVTPMAKLVEFLVPERPVAKPAAVEPRYLDAILLETPAVALEQVRSELGRLGQYTRLMTHKALAEASTGTSDSLKALVKMDDDVDALHQAIITYLEKLAQQQLLVQQSVQLSNFMSAANYIENIGNRIKINIITAGTDRINHNAHISEGTYQLLKAIDDQVVWAVDAAIEALAKNDPALGQQVIDERPAFKELLNQAEERLSFRMTAPEPNRTILFHIEFEIIEYHERIYYFAERIATIAISASIQVPHSTSDGRDRPAQATDITSPVRV